VYAFLEVSAIVDRDDMKKNIAIIGGGPAGLMAAVVAVQETDVRVVLYEKNPQPGAKLMISGSGQCNIASAGPLPERLGHYPDHVRDFLRPSLKAASLSRILDWFVSHGVRFELRHAGRKQPLSVHRAEQGEGKIFPLAGGAALIRDVLVREFLEHKGEFHGQEGVQKIEKTGYGFVITTNSHNSSREYDAVICATGGYTWPKTGSTGDGYRFARELGHTIVPSVPALTAIICPEEEIRGMSGVALRDVRVRIERAGMLLDVERAGDVLFTHRGLSGPAILDASYAMQRGDHVLIRCLDDERAAAMESGILEKADREGSLRLSRIIESTGLPKAVQDLCLERLGLDRADRLATLGKKRISALVVMLKNLRYRVVDLVGRDQAMCTAGGVALGEIDSTTMASKIVPGLFFCGEVMDIHGDCGGYNIHAALATGWVAGSNAAGSVVRP